MIKFYLILTQQVRLLLQFYVNFWPFSHLAEPFEVTIYILLALTLQEC